MYLALGDSLGNLKSLADIALMLSTSNLLNKSSLKSFISASVKPSVFKISSILSEVFSFTFSCMVRPASKSKSLTYLNVISLAVSELRSINDFTDNINLLNSFEGSIPNCFSTSLRNLISLSMNCLKY